MKETEVEPGQAEAVPDGAKRERSSESHARDQQAVPAISLSHQPQLNGIKDMSSDELRQRDVPALPELDRISGQIGSIEVHRCRNAHQLADAERDLAVAAEVQVEPEVADL